MNVKKFIRLLAVVSIASSIAVGCKKGPERMTIMPGRGAAGPRDDTGQPIAPAPPVDTTSTGGIPLSDLTGFVPSAEQPFRSETVHFDFDKATIRSSEVSKIESVASGMRSRPGKALRIEGHCDERGTEEYNRALGERRALAIREHLVRLGMDHRLIDTISYGEDRPVDPSHNESAWAKNRRGEFILLEPPGPTTNK